MMRLARAPEEPTAESATLVEWKDGGLSIRALAPSPPGARLEFEVDLGEERRTPPFRLKVHRCRRQEDGTFLLEGRPIDLRRETREALDSLGTLA